MVDIRHLENR